MTLSFSCSDVDDLAAAHALGALDTDEQERVAEHVMECPEPHGEFWEMQAVAGILPESLEPVQPRAATRARLMATIETTQLGRVPAAAMAAAAPAAPARTTTTRTTVRTTTVRRVITLSPAVAVALATAAVLVMAALTGWNIQLRAELEARERSLETAAAIIADSRAAYRVTGTAAVGYLVETQSGAASLLVTDVAEVRAGELYAMWLMSDAGTAPAGTFTPPPDSSIVVATLERPLTNYTRFVVTVESAQLEEPSGDFVMTADLDS